MAENTDEKELNLDEQDSSNSGSDSPKSKKKLLLIAGAVIVAAIGAGGYFFLMPGDSEEEIVEEEIQIPIEESHYLKLEPAFVINLPDRGKQRFLQASITIMAYDSSALFKIEQHMPVIRHNLTNVLSAQTITSIQSPGGIEEVRTQALDQLNRVLIEEYGSAAIDQVLFTAFVMQ